MAAPPFRRSPAKAALAVFLGVFLGLLACEGVLRVRGYLYLQRSGREAGGEVAGLTILCHGDSNVFGIYEEPEDTYPERLERWLNARAEGGPHRVVNLGIPGLSSQQLWSHAREDLERYRPAAFLVTVGFNNSWAWTPEAGMAYEGLPWWEELRLVRLARLVHLRWTSEEGRREDPAFAPATDAAEGEVVFHAENREGQALSFFSGERGQKLSREEKLTLLGEHLIGLDELCDELGVQLVLVTYGSERLAYGRCNDLMRALAEERGLPLVDSGAGMATLEERFGFGEVFHADHHPRSVGYELIAREAYNRLVALGLARGEPLADPLEDLEPPDHEPPQIRITGRLDGAVDSPEELTIEIAGEVPGKRFRFVLWDLHEGPDPPPAKPFEEVLDQDRLFLYTWHSRELRATFDEEGEARIRLGKILAEDGSNDGLRGKYVMAGYVVMAGEAGRAIARLSDTLQLRLD